MYYETLSTSQLAEVYNLVTTGPKVRKFSTWYVALTRTLAAIDRSGINLEAPEFAAKMPDEGRARRSGPSGRRTVEPDPALEGDDA